MNLHDQVLQVTDMIDYFSLLFRSLYFIGGKDNYAYSFKPESRQSDEGVFVNGTLHHQMNNNDLEQENLNLLNRKVSLRRNLFMNR